MQLKLKLLQCTSTEKTKIQLLCYAVLYTMTKIPRINENFIKQSLTSKLVSGFARAPGF